jgi:predicted phosphodiesterase
MVRMWLVVLLAGVVAGTAFGAGVSDLKEFSFLLDADSRNSRHFPWALSQMKKVAPDAAFLLSAGDVDPVSETQKKIKAALGPDFLWVPVVGNHDTGKSNLSVIESHNKTLPFAVNPGPAGSRNTTYSFDYGPAHFVCLDTYDRNAQKGRMSWLEKDLATSKKPFKFVIAHGPIFSDYRGAYTEEKAKKKFSRSSAMWKMFEKHKVTAYLCGHSHKYAVFQPRSGAVWEINAGNSGNSGHSGDDGQTFLVINIDSKKVMFDTWRGEDGSPFKQVHAWSVDTTGGHAGTSKRKIMEFPFEHLKKTGQTEGFLTELPELD